VTPQQAASVLLERRACRQSLVSFASRVPVPGSPYEDADETARIPLIETQQAEHHKLILAAMQRCMSERHGRLMVMAPPGSAKSTYASVVAPAWYLGTGQGRRVILASYGDDLAKRHGRRTRQLLRSAETIGVLQTEILPESRAADDFRLANGSEYLACGVLGAVTGNRAHGLIIDDPIRGREDADSQTIRSKTFAAYEDDLKTRLIPGGWIVIISTRWHEDDLCGRILPSDWSGESGQIRCRDGQTWEVLCIQAECQTHSDPLGRRMGQMLWPEWFDARHWDQFRLNRRTWSSLYQQRPAPDEGVLFRRDDMATYEKAPGGLMVIGASDYAVTPDGGDWTEHGVAGIAPDGGVYLLDWWRGQTGPEEWIEKKLDMIATHNPLAWYGETGPITKAVEGTLRRRMGERQIFARMEWLPHIGDKAAKAQAIIARAGAGRLFWPRAAWVPELQRQCLVFPAGSPDDGVDTLGMLGRGADKIGAGMSRKSTGAVLLPGSSLGAFSRG
jgi:predicted phage terminase large subunit-like protein